MKSIYAVPVEQVREAEMLCQTYSKHLEELSEDAIVSGDSLRSFAESLGAPVFKLDDDDWTVVRRSLEDSGDAARLLAGEILWSCEAARSVVKLLESPHAPPLAHTVAGWLQAQVTRHRVVILLTT